MTTTAPSGAAIRYATREDVNTVFSFICKFAEYEKASDEVYATEESLEQTLSYYDPFSSTFSEGFAKSLLLTDPDGAVAGMALYFYNYSTRTGTPGIYLKDIFVEPAYRKKGYGKALLKELAKEVAKVGGRGLEWSCWAWNEPGLQFYEKETTGAKRKQESICFRIEGDALGKLIGS